MSLLLLFINILAIFIGLDIFLFYSKKNVYLSMNVLFYLYIITIYPKTFKISSTKSSISSTPTLRRNKLSTTPAASRSALGIDA